MDCRTFLGEMIRTPPWPLGTQPKWYSVPISLVDCFDRLRIPKVERSSDEVDRRQRAERSSRYIPSSRPDAIVAAFPPRHPIEAQDYSIKRSLWVHEPSLLLCFGSLK